MYSGRASQIIAGRRLAAEGESLSVAAAGSRLPETADVVVVGAGIIGLSIACLRRDEPHGSQARN